MFRVSLAIAVAVAVLATAMPGGAQQKARVSPHETIFTKGATGMITITYGRPYSKDPKSGEIRQVWGKLVPYGKAWRAGADEATLLLTQQNLMVGDTLVPAGSYTLYLVPQEKSAKLAISKKVGGWGIPVDEKNDLARVDMKQDKLPTKLDQFTIALEKSSDGALLKMMWENTQYSVPITVKK